MIRKGRKGRVSNELVAASCAAILTVYGAGYWRTRDEARRFASEAQRRPARSAPGVAPTLPTASPPLAATEAPIAPAAPAAPPAATEPKPAAEKSLQAATAPPSTPAAAKPAQPPVLAPGPVAEVAVASAESAPPALPVGIWHDGSYSGWGQSYHGDIEAGVTIKDGRIVGAGIVTCATRYPCSVIYDILNQPVVRQSPDVDRVSRATESADAYYGGLVEALKKAEAGPAVPSISQ